MKQDETAPAAATPPSTPPVTVALGPVELAGRWRRLGAFVIDCLLLGLAGSVLGLLIGPWLCQLGAWARALGFAIALAYFGVLNSRLGGGRTVGKRLLRLRVVRGDGQPVAPGRALLRFCLLGAPWFLNGLPLSPQILTTPLATLLSLLVFGLGLSIVYLWLFNSTTRQSLHDFAVGTYVVHGAGTPLAPPAPAWRGHAWVVGLIAAGALAAPALLQNLAGGLVYAPLLAIQQRMMQEPEVRYARVYGQIMRNFNSGQSGKSFRATVVLRQRLSDDKPLADRLATIVLRQYPGADQLDRIDIGLAYGYDLGIASGWLRDNYSGSPQRWKQHLDTGADPAVDPGAAAH